ncbi:hypothetical protein NS334_15770 [Sphingomonas endophytica]|uniref:Uncharacterized protein n=1 Tax=Sphingomonas endophytica TaxID=869719 RepID=A0A147HVK8_9SPHN|nr:hypothetical protein NS334_15770 [Sphingomonas endophytica]
MISAGTSTGYSADGGPHHDLCRASGDEPFLVPARRLQPRRTLRRSRAARPHRARNRRPGQCRRTGARVGGTEGHGVLSV